MKRIHDQHSFEIFTKKETKAQLYLCPNQQHTPNQQLITNQQGVTQQPTTQNYSNMAYTRSSSNKQPTPSESVDKQSTTSEKHDFDGKFTIESFDIFSLKPLSRT